MANEMNQQSRTKICPTCGTRMNESATRCLVCGRSFANEPQPSGRNNAPAANDNERIEKPRLKNITISVPIAIGLFLLLIAWIDSVLITRRCNPWFMGIIRILMKWCSLSKTLRLELTQHRNRVQHPISKAENHSIGRNMSSLMILMLHPWLIYRSASILLFDLPLVIEFYRGHQSFQVCRSASKNC